MTNECGISRPGWLRVLWSYIEFWCWLMPRVMLSGLFAPRKP
jgi:hypothetical protein